MGLCFIIEDVVIYKPEVTFFFLFLFSLAQQCITIKIDKNRCKRRRSKKKS
jgi:hypothetical protein